MMSQVLLALKCYDTFNWAWAGFVNYIVAGDSVVGGLRR